jgi:hypothetical protein
MRPASAAAGNIATHGAAIVKPVLHRKVGSGCSMQNVPACARDPLRANRRQESASESTPGNGHAGRKLDQRTQHERARAHPRMRDFEARVMQPGAAVEQDIEIECARRVPLVLAHAPMPALDGAQAAEQPERWQRRLQRGNRVDEFWLRPGESIGALT